MFQTNPFCLEAAAPDGSELAGVWGLSLGFKPGSWKMHRPFSLLVAEGPLLQAASRPAPTSSALCHQPLGLGP